MNFFGGLFSSPETQQNDEHQNKNENDLLTKDISMQRPAYTLDELKRAGLPLKSQISPYLQVCVSLTDSHRYIILIV